MEILIKTFFANQQYTLSRLFINGVYQTDVIEDTIRALPASCPDTPKEIDCTCKEKVYAKTAIMAGRYKCVFNMSNKFRRKLLLILNTPHFRGIRMHRGNTEVNSAGCLIVGENKAKGQVVNSAFWEVKLNELFDNASKKGEEIYITIDR